MIDKISDLTKRVIGCAFAVHNELGAGFSEKVYENSLKIELEESHIAVEQQVPIAVRYRDKIVGDYLIDLFVENRLILELKALRALTKEHEVQLVGYLAATRIDDGLLVNFGPSVDVKRKYKDYQSASQ